MRSDQGTPAECSICVMVDHPPRSTLTLQLSSTTERRRYLMKAIKAFVKGHPLLSYFALAFAISWGAVLTVIVVGHGSILATKEQFETLILFAGPAMLLGPSVAGLLLTGLLYGKAG